MEGVQNVKLVTTWILTITVSYNYLPIVPRLTVLENVPGAMQDIIWIKIINVISILLTAFKSISMVDAPNVSLATILTTITTVNYNSLPIVLKSMPMENAPNVPQATIWTKIPTVKGILHIALKLM